MHPTNGLFFHLSQRFGTLSLTVIVVLTFALIAAAGLTVLLAGELLAAGADPVQVAPFRWAHRC